jgi:alpha-beta hydrolase superfamily lysophospholipase
MRIAVLSFVLLGVGCGGDDDEALDAGSDGGLSGSDGGGVDGGPMGECARVGDDPEVVSLTTDDGLALAADFYGSGVPGGAAVVLLHMIPPNDRSNYERPFIDRLVDRDLAVLNVDRRGAGDSEGDGMDAYLGDSGWLDAKAAFLFLGSHACAFDATRIAIVGASNGSTTALDFAIRSADDAAVGEPAALVFLTAGTYTENQHAIADYRPLLDPLPILFVYSTAERDFSVAFEPTAPSTWQFLEYEMGAHGTQMFAAVPASMDDVANFLDTALP